MVMLIMSFSNVQQKKRKEESNIFFYIIIYVLLAFHVMIHLSLYVCVCDSFLHFSIARQKKKKLTMDFLSLYALFS